MPATDQTLRVGRNKGETPRPRPPSRDRTGVWPLPAPDRVADPRGPCTRGVAAHRRWQQGERWPRCRAVAAKATALQPPSRSPARLATQRAARPVSHSHRVGPVRRLLGPRRRLFRFAPRAVALVRCRPSQPAHARPSCAHTRPWAQRCRAGRAQRRALCARRCVPAFAVSAGRGRDCVGAARAGRRADRTVAAQRNAHALAPSARRVQGGQAAGRPHPPRPPQGHPEQAREGGARADPRGLRPGAVREAHPGHPEGEAGGREGRAALINETESAAAARLSLPQTGGDKAEKRAYKMAKQRLGTHVRAVRKRAEVQNIYARQRAAAAAAAAAGK